MPSTELVFVFANPSAPMPRAKKRKDGIVKWLKTITGIETEDSKAAKKKPLKRG